MYDAVHDRLTLCAEHNSAAVCSCIYLPGAWCVTSEEAETQSQLFFHTCTALSFIYLRVCSLIFLCRVVVTDRWPKLRSRGRKLGKNRKRKTMPPTESTSLTLSFLCKRLCAARCEHRNGVHTSQYTRRNNANTRTRTLYRRETLLYYLEVAPFFAAFFWKTLGKKCVPLSLQYRMSLVVSKGRGVAWVQLAGSR